MNHALGRIFHRVPPIRLLGFVSVAAFVLLIARFWHPVYGFTSLIQLDASNDAVKIAAFREYPVYVYEDTGGYDGLYYAQIAYHPALTAPELAPAMDQFAYRARRILPAAFSWLLAIGNPASIVHVYACLNIVAWFVLAYVLWRYLKVDNTRSFIAWFGLLFSAGALASVRLALTDLPALLLLVLAFVSAQRASVSAGWLAASALSRETALLALPALLQRPWFTTRTLRTFLVVAAPLFLWLFYVRAVTGSTGTNWGNFDWPFNSLIHKWRDVFASFAHEPDRWLVWSSFFALVGLMVQAAYFLANIDWKDSYWRLGAAYVGLMAVLGYAVWEGFPGAATRVLLPLGFAFNVQVLRKSSAITWLLLGNLGLFSGLLAMNDVPKNFRELAAARSNGIPIVATLGGGWSNREKNSQHTWAWSSGQGALQLKTWSKTSRRIRLEFSLRSLKPAQVKILHAGRTIWAGTVTAQLERHTLDLSLDSDLTTLTFASDQAAADDAGAADPRKLSFALYDLKFSVREP